MIPEITGVWITYSWDMSVLVNSVYVAEIDALRAAVSSGYLKVAFVPFGAQVSDEVKS